MNVRVVQIGNSRGIRIPQQVLDRCGIDNAVDLTVEGTKIVLSPVKTKPRHDWEQQAKQMRENGDDELLIPDVFPDDADLECRS